MDKDLNINKLAYLFDKALSKKAKKKFKLGVDMIMDALKEENDYQQELFNMIGKIAKTDERIKLEIKEKIPELYKMIFPV